METRELLHILAAIIILFVVISFATAIKGLWQQVPQLLVFAIIITLVPIIIKKAVALYYDARLEHEILFWQRYGFKPHWKLAKPIPLGIILPLFVTVFSLGIVKLMTFLSYESYALKRRAAKRHGYYSYTEMTDWHNGLIGASGIVSLLALSLISYFFPFQGADLLSRLSAYYAFWNTLPFLKLDGAQIFFGSRIIYTILGIIVLIFLSFALFTI